MSKIKMKIEKLVVKEIAVNRKVFEVIYVKVEDVEIESRTLTSRGRSPVNAET